MNPGRGMEVEKKKKKKRVRRGRRRGRERERGGKNWTTNQSNLDPVGLSPSTASSIDLYCIISLRLDFFIYLLNFLFWSIYFPCSSYSSVDRVFSWNGIVYHTLPDIANGDDCTCIIIHDGTIWMILYIRRSASKVLIWYKSDQKNRVQVTDTQKTPKGQVDTSTFPRLAAGWIQPFFSGDALVCSVGMESVIPLQIDLRRSGHGIRSVASGWCCIGTFVLYILYLYVNYIISIFI